MVGEKPCILIIDDSHLELRATSRILSSMYNVKIASGGREGIKIALEEEIALILLDLNMPEMSGFEVLIELKDNELTKDIPVIIITSSESSNDEVRGLALGASDFIRKPLDAIVTFRVSMCLQLVSQMKMIERFGLIDGLTGINNRRSFDQSIKTAWAHALRSKTNIGLMMIDVDKFKNFNDEYGHINGDLCLQVIADKMVKTLMRGNDSVYRWGGEEFAVILPETPIEGVLEVAERIRKNIECMPVKLGEVNAYVTVSIGAGSIIPRFQIDQEDEFENFKKSIDDALYLAKKSGRNRVESCKK